MGRRIRRGGFSGYDNDSNFTPHIRIGRELNPFPDVFYTTLIYFENNYRLDLGTSDKILNMDFAINDPYDPYVSTGGKSANLFDQIGSVYRYCRAEKAEILVEYTDNGSANNDPIQTALVYNSEGVPYADMDDIASLPQSKRIVQLGMTNRIGSTKRIRGTFFPYSSFYMSKLQWNMQESGSPYDVTNIGGFASPANLAIVSLYYSRVDESSTTAVSNRATIKIKYYCKFYDRQAFIVTGKQIGRAHV